MCVVWCVRVCESVCESVCVCVKESVRVHLALGSGGSVPGCYGTPRHGIVHGIHSSHMSFTTATFSSTCTFMSSSQSNLAVQR